MYKNFNDYLNEDISLEPHSKDAPIILQDVGCSANYNDDNKTISIIVPNKDEFVVACSSFKWREGYPKTVTECHRRCVESLDNIKSGDLVKGLQGIFKMPYSPYLVSLFETDRPMLDDLRYIVDQSSPFEKERIEQFILSLVEEGEDQHILRKSDPEVYAFFKQSLENLVLYLKSKCEVFFWFYQGLPQLSKNGIW